MRMGKPQARKLWYTADLFGSVFCPVCGGYPQKGKIMLKKTRLLTGALFAGALCLAALLFSAGCDTSNGPYVPYIADSTIPLPAALTGKWLSSYGEEFEISAAKFTSSWGGSPTYAGNVVHVRSDGTGGGYITIRYTINTYTPKSVGRFYVIHWKNLTATTVEISGSSDADGRATLFEAEIEYTVLNGYFDIHSSCTKVSGGTVSYHSEVEGTWTSISSDEFIITDKTITYKYSSFPLFTADIVNVRNLDGDKNYITFKYTNNDVDNSLIGQYCVLYWENFNDVAGTVDMSVASENWSPGDDGRLTQNEAEAEFTIEDPDDYYDLYSYTRSP
jgi:hypothetical protein